MKRILIFIFFLFTLISYQSFSSPIFIVHRDDFTIEEINEIFKKYYGEYDDFEKMNFILDKSEKEELIKQPIDEENWEFLLEKYNEQYLAKKEVVEKNDFWITFKYNYKYYYSDILILMIFLIVSVTLFFPFNLFLLEKDKELIKKNRKKYFFKKLLYVSLFFIAMFGFVGILNFVRQ